MTKGEKRSATAKGATVEERPIRRRVSVRKGVMTKGEKRSATAKGATVEERRFSAALSGMIPALQRLWHPRPMNL
jgi:hypothetical protein